MEPIGQGFGRGGAMSENKQFPVMQGAEPASRDAQLHGLVERVWADSFVYHEDVEPMLRQWLALEHCVVPPDEFEALLAKARADFDDVAADVNRDFGPSRPSTPTLTLVSRIRGRVEGVIRRFRPEEVDPTN
jgi:hypothetical protein